MHARLRPVLASAFLLLGPAPGLAEPQKPEWKPEELKLETAACTEALVRGAWENTKREQNIDPKMEMTPEIRKELEPQIAKMAGVCDCAVREAAKKFGRDDSNKPEFQHFVIDTVMTGKCKPRK